MRRFSCPPGLNLIARGRAPDGFTGLHILGIFTGMQDEWMGPGIDWSAIACPVALGLKNPGISTLLPLQTVRTLLTLQRATGPFQDPAQSAAQGGTEIPRQPGFAGKAAVKRKYNTA